MQINFYSLYRHSVDCQKEEGCREKWAGNQNVPFSINIKLGHIKNKTKCVLCWFKSYIVIFIIIALKKKKNYLIGFPLTNTKFNKNHNLDKYKSNNTPRGL